LEAPLLLLLLAGQEVALVHVHHRHLLHPLVATRNHLFLRRLFRFVALLSCVSLYIELISQVVVNCVHLVVTHHHHHDHVRVPHHHHFLHHLHLLLLHPHQLYHQAVKHDHPQQLRRVVIVMDIHWHHPLHHRQWYLQPQQVVQAVVVVVVQQRQHRHHQELQHRCHEVQHYWLVRLWIEHELFESGMA
jgi:hypothetical protein